MVSKIFSLDRRSLAFYRICLSWLLLVEIALRAANLKAFYSDQGVLPRLLYFQEFPSAWRFSVFFMTGSVPLLWVLFAIGFAAAFALMVGWRTRQAAFILWFFVISLQVRNPLVNTNADHFMRLLLFWSVLMPLGAFLSVDALKTPSHAVQTKSIYSPAHIFYFFQIAMIYWIAAWHKAEDPVWMKGDAVFCSLANLNATTVPAQFLLRFPALLKGLDYAVIIFEFVGPFLLFVPIAFIRLLAVLSFIVLQLGFGTFMYLGQFPFVSLTAMTPFIPGTIWDSLARLPLLSAIPSAFAALLQKALRLDFIKKSGPPSYDAPWWSRILGSLCLLFVVYWNLCILHPRFRVPVPVSAFGTLLGIQQEWGVFVPPGDFSIWYEIPGKLADGRIIDLSPNPKPDYKHLWKRNFKWERYMGKLWSNKEYRNFYPYLGGYLCQEWNRKNLRSTRLVSLEVIGIYQFFYPVLKQPKRSVFYQGTCP